MTFALADRYPRHAGILLAAQASWSTSGLIQALDRLLLETVTEAWVGQVRWLEHAAGRDMRFA